MKWKLNGLFKRKKRTTSRSRFDSDSGEYTNLTNRRPMGSQIALLLMRMSQWSQVHGQPLLRTVDWRLIRAVSLMLALSFVLASVVSTYSANLVFRLVATVKGGATAQAATSLPPGGALRAAIVQAQTGSSPQILKEAIVKRNLFNSDGTLAPEGDPNDPVRKTADLDFDKVACSAEKLPVQVVGTIYTGNPAQSFVAIKDPKVTDSDIYEPGKVIIDFEDIEVYCVHQGMVEFRKGDTKICVDVAGREGTKTVSSGGGDAPRPEATESIEINDAEMKSLLGPELARAMNEAKLIPEVAPGSSTVQGFRLLAIVPGSIFDRLKLQNEDLIQEVNGVSLKDPTQGFRLLEALQQQRDITIAFTRKGEPMVRKVRVK